MKLAQGREKPNIAFDPDIMRAVLRRLYNTGRVTPQMLTTPEVKALINETYKVLNGAIGQSITQETPAELTHALRENAFIFSGFKAYHNLREIGLSLTEEDGTLKPFAKFAEDVKGVDARYNQRYLYAEYNHAVHTSQMAVKWNDFTKDGDEYNLQYRTAGDERVRSDHARLDGVTLPPSDKFWNNYLPPNGWNCRCQVVQVLKDDYPLSDSDAATEWGDECTADPKAQIFRYNAGKEMEIFPPRHPYFKAPAAVGKVVKKLAQEALPKESEAFTAKTVAEAEEYLQQFCEARAIDKTFKGKVSLSGVSVENANEIVKGVEKVFALTKTGKISGIRTVDPSSATGKKVFKSGENAIACYDPITKGIWINKEILKNPEAFNTYIQRSRAAYDAIKQAVKDGKIKDPAKLAIAERYIKAGRELVDDSIAGCIIHELGHHIQWQMPSSLINSLGEGRAIRSLGISGYSGGGSIGEYIAESFVSWARGELRCDYRLQEYFDSISKQVPVNRKGEYADSGHWSEVGTKAGAVRTHSRHGVREREQNERIASYMADKYGREIDLIPQAKQGKNPDSFDKTIGKFVEYKEPTQNTYSAFDNCLRDGGEQANNIIIWIGKDASLGTLANALNSRIQWRENVESVRIIREGKDALYTRKQITSDGFKIEEADFN